MRGSGKVLALFTGSVTLLRKAPRTAPEIAQLLGTTQDVVRPHIEHLIDEGHVEYLGKRPSARGNHAREYGWVGDVAFGGVAAEHSSN